MKTHKTLKKIYHIALTSVMVILISNCKQDDNTSQTTTVVYTAGRINDMGVYVPCYWINHDFRQDLQVLDSSKDGVAWDIQVVGETIYTVGRTQNDMGIYVPCYWIDNSLPQTLPVLDENQDGYAYAIEVIGGTVYTAGWTTHPNGHHVPCYWINREERHDLPVPNPTNNGSAGSIQIIGGEVYTAGYFLNDMDNLVPCYWRGHEEGENNPVELPVLGENKSGNVNDIHITGSTIYAAGNSQRDTNDAYAPCYWEANDPPTPLLPLDLGRDAFASSIKVIENNITGDNIYVAGYTNNNEGNFIPCYWHNEERTDLLSETDPMSYGEAYDIDVEGNTAYVAGYFRNDGGNNIPCYWKNDTLIDLSISDPNRYGEVYGIQVVREE